MFSLIKKKEFDIEFKRLSSQTFTDKDEMPVKLFMKDEIILQQHFLEKSFESHMKLQIIKKKVEEETKEKHIKTLINEEHKLEDNEKSIPDDLTKMNNKIFSEN